jgi:homoserine kinase
MNEIKIFCPATIANLSCGFDARSLLRQCGDEMIQKIQSKRDSTKIVGADLPLETERNVAVLPVWLCLMRLKQILVDIEIKT